MTTTRCSQLLFFFPLAVFLFVLCPSGSLKDAFVLDRCQAAESAVIISSGGGGGGGGGQECILQKIAMYVEST